MSQRRSYPNSGDFNLDDLFRPEPGQQQGQQQGQPGQPPGQPQGQPPVPPGQLAGPPQGHPGGIGTVHLPLDDLVHHVVP
ncbi:hypothetical protein ACWC5I_29150, partial [Kitasatospora sp. NPDC001574]